MNLKNLDDMNKFICEDIFPTSINECIEEQIKVLEQLKMFRESGLEAIAPSDYIPFVDKMYNANKPGVYLLFHYPDDEVKYIGRANKINSRVSSHIRVFKNGGKSLDKTKNAGAVEKMYKYDSDINKWGVFWYVTPNLTCALKLEEDLILSYAPVYNSQHMGGV
jgi:hypothetical protein